MTSSSMEIFFFLLQQPDFNSQISAYQADDFFLFIYLLKYSW